MAPESIVDYRAARCNDDATQPTAGMRVTDIQPVGTYGVKFAFSRGHDWEIFRWIFLKSLLEKNLSRASAAAGRG
ncbi:MAG: gamma-butyrobetaine hydroxylase-like domain-containing protein [Variovorax sp.]